MSVASSRRPVRPGRQATAASASPIASGFSTAAPKASVTGCCAPHISGDFSRVFASLRATINAAAAASQCLHLLVGGSPGPRDAALAVDQAGVLGLIDRRRDETRVDTERNKLALWREQPTVFPAAMTHMLDQQKIDQPARMDA